MASRGINKVILVGNVGQDPDVKSFQSGQDRFTTEVVVRWPNGSLQLVGGARGDSSNSNTGESFGQHIGNSQQPTYSQPSTTTPPQNTWSTDNMIDDDIPF